MKEIVERIARALVDRPEDVEVTQVEGENTTVLELRVAQGDLGNRHTALEDGISSARGWIERTSSFASRARSRRTSMISEGSMAAA